MPHPSPPKKRFLLVDDHTLIRTGLTSILKLTYPDAIVEAIADGSPVIEKLKTAVYDLIIMDIQMPDTDALQLINYIHLKHVIMPVLVYSMTAENIYALRVLKAGARGFVSKGSSTEVLKKAIGAVLKGKTFLSEELTQLLSKQKFNMPVTPFAILSAREHQIVSLLLAGKTVTGISKMLDIKNSTVGTHKAKIFKKLNVTNLLQIKEMSDTYQFL